MTIHGIIQAILFDVDGVVVESELLHMQTFNELLEPLGIHISEKDWKTRFLGAGSAKVMSTLFNEYGVNKDPQPWISRRRILYQDRVAKGDLNPVLGFLDFYKSVKTANLPIAFVSTGHPVNLSAALGSLGLLDQHPIIDVTQVARLKPDPEAYILGAQALNVSPSSCLVFEDSPIGVEAAKAANMTCVALTTTNPAEDLQQADFIINNFAGWTIHLIVEKLNRQLVA